jgi:hypothetical protein
VLTTYFLREAPGETPEGVSLDVRHDVGVGVHRLVYVSVAEDLLEDLHRLVGLHPEGSERVPQGVEPRRRRGSVLPMTLEDPYHSCIFFIA